MKHSKILLKGGLILFISFNIHNAINFLFQFSMARFLTVKDYGILVALLSILYLISVFTESIQTVIVKYSSRENSRGRLKNLIKKSLKKSFRVSLLLFVLYSIFSIILSFTLKIAYPLLLLNGLIIFTSFLLPVTRGVMLGRKSYGSLGLNMVIDALTKLIIGIILVIIGWKLYGAIVSVFIGTAFAFIISFFSLRKIISAKEEKAKTDNIYRYTAPVFFLTLTITTFYSIDVIIAKIMFNEEIAGYYAIASILAKTVFWGISPIIKAMFPLSAENKKSKPSSHIFKETLLIVISLILIALLAMYFFPDLIVRIFSGRYIPQSALILFYVTLGMAIVSLSYLIISYKLSMGRTKGYYFFLVFVLIEILLLSYFSINLISFSIAFIVSSVILLLGALLLLEQDENFNNNTSTQ